jgi:hypothetical protein
MKMCVILAQRMKRGAPVASTCNIRRRTLLSGSDSLDGSRDTAGPIYAERHVLVTNWGGQRL